MMPEGAADGRSDQLATLKGIAHELLTAPDMGELLAQADQDMYELDDWQRANLREMRRVYHSGSLKPLILLDL